jgi:hypothetical protein
MQSSPNRRRKFAPLWRRSKDESAAAQACLIGQAFDQASLLENLFFADLRRPQRHRAQQKRGHMVAQTDDGGAIVFMMARAALTTVCDRRSGRRPIGRRPETFSLRLGAAAARPAHAHGRVAFRRGWPAIGGRVAFRGGWPAADGRFALGGG